MSNPGLTYHDFVELPLHGWRVGDFDSTKYQIHITHLKSGTFGFASGRSAS